MAKTLNEHAGNLKELIIDLQSDAHNSSSISTTRYNNLKLTMDPLRDSSPHVVINLAMSEATYSIRNGEKVAGSLGPEERYVQRWFNKGTNLISLHETWIGKVKNRDKAFEGE